MTSELGTNPNASEPSQPFGRENRILALMLEVGTDFAEISRRSGISERVVRYLYREHITRRRIRIQRETHYEKLGLEGIQFMVNLDPEMEPLFYRDALLSNVWVELYTKSIYRIVPDQLFFFNHMAPPAFHQKLWDMYHALEDLGILKVEETYNCSRLKHPRMWVEDFDLNLPGWDFDWSSLKPPENVDDNPSHKSEQVEFDKHDLSLLVGFEYDYAQTVSDVAKRMKLSRAVASWHFRKHVEDRGILATRFINWLGTYMDPKTGMVAPRQSYIGITFLAKRLSTSEMMNVRAHLHSIPYLWSEKIGDADYCAETFIPVHSLMEAFKFFSKILRPLEGRARIVTADQSCSAGYAFSPDLFDDESGQWIYKGDLVLEGIRRSLAGGSLRQGGKEGDGRRLEM